MARGIKRERAKILSALAVLSVAFAQPVSGQTADAQATGATPQRAREYFDLPVNIDAPIEPIPVKGVDGKWYLVYHLFLTNWGFSDLTLKSVEVSGGASAGVILTVGD